jgi:peroxiredoxin/uncharacterized membrane protein YphA (DoxX/SURF4 family)
MDLLIESFRILLFLVFAVASSVKILDQKRTRQMLLDFKVSPNSVGFIRIALPISEAIVSILMLVPETTTIGAILAIILLTIFSVVTGWFLYHGHRPNCRCLGMIDEGPIGSKTLMRNSLLIIAALVLVLTPESEGLLGFALIEHISESVTLSSILSVIALLSAFGSLLLSYHLWHQQARLLVLIETLEKRPGRNSLSPAIRNNGLPIGSVAPIFSLPEANREMRWLEELIAGKSGILLVFMDSDCPACHELIQDTHSLRKNLPTSAELVFITSSNGSDDSNSIEGVRVLRQSKFEVGEKYSIAATPSAVWVNAQGLIWSPTVQGAGGVKSLAQHVADLVTDIRAVVKGDSVPELVLIDPAGIEVKLPDLFQGREGILVFFDPNCSHCLRLLPELKSIIAQPGESKTEINVISRGTIDEIHKLGLGAIVLADEDGTAIKAFGANGTPAAIKIAYGRIASVMVLGVPKILQLLRGEDRDIANHKTPSLFT